jgi:hypothetical protein
MAATHLYNNEEGNYAFRVAPHGRPGLASRQLKRPGAAPKRLFYVPSLWRGVQGHPRVRRSFSAVMPNLYVPPPSRLASKVAVLSLAKGSQL